MKLIPVILLLFITSALIPLCGCQSCTINNHTQQDIGEGESFRYSIVITNYYFGRIHTITTVTQDSIESVRDNLNGVKTTESRALTGDETKRLKTFLLKFPVRELKDRYSDDSVEDGFVLTFSITINDIHKDISVANFYQDDLCKLAGLIAGMLKEDYIGYDKK